MSDATKSKAEIIAERQANLPLPEDPPVASDWNSADARINAGSGERQDDTTFGGDSTGLREPATAASAVREDGDALHENTAGLGVGRTAKDDLGGIPSDAVTRDAKNKPGVVDTTNKDYGYPQKNDPSNGEV